MFRLLALLPMFALLACSTEIARPELLARADLAAACGERDGWSDPAPPAPVLDNLTYVGTCGVTVLLLTSPDGHVLFDGATEQAVPSILANIRKAGFDPNDIRWIVSSHEHYDHVGGLAALKAATGAKVAASAAAAQSLTTGRAIEEDPQAAHLPPFAPVVVDKILKNGEHLAVGSLRLMMLESPVHAPGSVNWTWSAAGPDGSPLAVVYADSLSTVSADDYSFSDHAPRLAAIREGLAKVAALPCDVLLTPHPAQSQMFERLAGRAPLIDAGACRAYAVRARASFEARLASERPGT